MMFKKIVLDDVWDDWQKKKEEEENEIGGESDIDTRRLCRKPKTEGTAVFAYWIQQVQRESEDIVCHA